MERRRRNTVVFALALMAGLLSAGSVAAQSCPVKIGGVLPLTGSMAPITKKIAQSAELAIEHVNQGGGIKGCPVQFILRDDQGQPTVGVDAAKYLVEVERVPAFTGTISSGVTGPIISSVTAPSKVVQITCCSTASPFTLDGRSGGYFFRTIPTSKTQAFATASETARRGMKKTVVIYINTDFGTDMLRFYKAAVAKLGESLAAFGMHPGTHGAALLHVLGLKEGADDVVGLAPEVLKVRTMEALRQLVLRASRRTPLAVMVDDLHWVDSASEDFLASLAEQIAGAALLVIVTYRPGYRPPWIDKSYATQIALQPLTTEESLTVNDNLAGSSQRFYRILVLD